MGFVDQASGDLALDAWQADVETSAEEVTAACETQVHFGVDRHVGRKCDFPLTGNERYRTSKHADQPAAYSCSGLVPMRGEPGVENLISRRPSDSATHRFRARRLCGFWRYIRPFRSDSL
jgi:hypothetical protein